MPRVLRCYGARTPSSTGHLPARQLADAVVAEISLLRATPSVGEGGTNRSALSFLDLLTAVITDEYRLPSHNAP